VKTLPVNLSDLALALEDHGENLNVYFFDTQTGEVLILSEDVDREQIEKIAEEASNRFVRIEPTDSREGYRIMENFVRSLPQSRLREKLEWSLDGPKPFRRFRDALREDDEIRGQWLRFHDAHMRKVAIQWLADLGIRPGVETDEMEVQEERVAPVLATEEGETWLDDDFDENDDFEEPGEIEEGEVFEPFSEEEETELMESIEPSPGEGISFAKLHGLLTALAAGPVPVSKPNFLDIILRAGWKSATDDQGKTERINELLEHFYDDIVDDITSETFVPRLEQRDIMVTDVVSDIGSWCQGFVFGLEQARPAWQRWFKDLRREKAISMIIGTANRNIQEKLDVAGAEEVAWTVHWFISDLVPLIWSYWHFESALDELVGPEAGKTEPQVGRNRPCPCGSGKKYKHCCGKTA
jgi:yecA family protein